MEKRTSGNGLFIMLNVVSYRYSTSLLNSNQEIRVKFSKNIEFLFSFFVCGRENERGN